ncbi:hypothetical protein [Campylobacter concisus]|uniref:Uncharacterized protein n=2 Tax=Campylobacter concisus TaxID=199 RepID=A0A7S9WW05_9BACT|nr:hypothetical protein [Campylobacter concisus]QPH95363.1 hypothetical protein CVT08_08070 [Campylobacter concisus]
MKKVKFIVFICLFILLPLAYFNGFIRISDLTSEQESIAKKYGGVYVFDEKLEREIDKREGERNKVNKEILKEVSNIQDKEEQNKQLRLLLQERFYDNPKLERVLSNGKRYYSRKDNIKIDNYKILNNYEEKLKEFMGKDYDQYENYLSINLGYFYIDNDTIVPISIGISTLYTEVIFGLYGDEASGIKFTKENTQRLIGDNKFYFIDNKFQKINK